MLFTSTVFVVNEISDIVVTNDISWQAELSQSQDCDKKKKKRKRDENRKEALLVFDLLVQ